MLLAGSRSVGRLIRMSMVLISIFSGSLALPQEKPVPMDRKTLSEFVGAYQWAEDHFIYIRFWDELGKDQLGAFDESGMVRALFPLGNDTFFVGAGLASPTPVEAHVRFGRNQNGTIKSLSWQSEGVAERIANRAEIYTEETV